MKTRKLLLAAALLFAAFRPAPLFAGDDEEAAARAEAKAALNRTEALAEEMDCTAKKTKLFADYLAGNGPLKGPYKFRCAGGKETITAPAWFAAEVSSMTAREMQIGKVTWNEARLWQEPLAAIYEFSELVRKTMPVKSGGLGLPVKFLYPGCLDSLVRLDKALANLRRERLAGSFGGRGDLVFSSLEKALAELDALEKTYEIGNQVSFYEKTAAVLRNGEEAFGALFSETPSFTPAGGAFSAEYLVAPRLLAGGRAVSLAFPAYQLEGLKRGDRVDLLVTYEYTAAGGAKDVITATVIQAAPVLAVAKPQDSHPPAQGSVKLLLNPTQAQYAALAAVQGRDLRLSARQEGDAEQKAMDAASFKKIIK